MNIERRQTIIIELLPADFLMRLSRFIEDQASGNVVVHYDRGKLMKYEVHEVYRPVSPKD